MRSRIILACADGASNVEVAAGLGVHLSTVGKWRRRWTWSACTTTRRSGPWCCAWTRSPRSKPWTDRSRSCR
nr:helix-turn-helix domain-containing protein [Micromonospora sonchi]